MTDKRVGAMASAKARLREAENAYERVVRKSVPVGAVVTYLHGDYVRRGEVLRIGGFGSNVSVHLLAPSGKTVVIDAYRVTTITVREGA